MSVKAITVRFHLDHPAEKQAWEKLLSLQTERHLSFSQAVTDALNACGTDTSGLPNADKDQLVQDITDAMALRLHRCFRRILLGIRLVRMALPLPWLHRKRQFSQHYIQPLCLTKRNPTTSIPILTTAAWTSTSSAADTMHHFAIIIQKCASQ